MLFTTLQWVLFLLVVFVAHHLVPGRYRKWLLLGASVYFYASWSAVYLLLIFGQLTVDWVCGQQLGKTEDDRRRKAIVAASVAINLTTLCVFKYYGFISRNLKVFGVALPVMDLELPLGISFYTFESMSYTIDVYRKRLRPVQSPLHLALFITWFPHLIAGPIVRPSELIPQFDAPSAFTRQRFFHGASLMLVGYLKKLLVADWLAQVVEPAFAQPAQCSSLELLLAVYAYAFQIYCDFSAYTDIARGASHWFGIELPENFDAPYLATSITDFWRRWHMTLSHWLRDYLYIPLGGNRCGALRTYFNLFATMLLGGLWHGASWTFVVWGGLHGALLALERLLGARLSAPSSAARAALQRVVVFHLVCFGWVFFRAQSFADAWAVLHGIAAGAFWLHPAKLLPVVGTVVIVAAYWSARPLRDRILKFDPGPSTVRQLAWVCAVGLCISVLTVAASSTAKFVYFQF
jgi:D-alanyl-lipoteichoic acid acyltransferase DltB (MBOAT superfamily)